jgi:hypothetical protein
MTAAEELALVDAALEALYTSNTQEYSIKDRSRRALELSQLIARKKELELTVQRSTYGIFDVAKFRNTD